MDLNGIATFVNCTFNNTGIGIAVNDSQCSARVLNSTFSGCIGGVVVPCKCVANLTNCTFSKMVDYAVLASNGSLLDMVGCDVSECIGDGVVVEGRGATKCTLTGCTIEKCRAGVRVGNGRVNVILDDVTIRDCKVGLYVAVDTVGPVALSDCALIANNMSRLNLGGDRCDFSIDGVAEQKGTQQVRLYSAAEFMTAVGIKHGYPNTSAAAKRVLNRAGMHTVTCAGCMFICEPGTPFKKCNRCRETRYCTKDCYIQHMSGTHFEVCNTIKLRSKMLSLNGYVACDKCGKG